MNRFKNDPVAFANALWPHVIFYREQEAILQSMVDNDETIVPAGNQLGVLPLSG